MWVQSWLYLSVSIHSSAYSQTLRTFLKYKHCQQCQFFSQICNIHKQLRISLYQAWKQPCFCCFHTSPQQQQRFIRQYSHSWYWAWLPMYVCLHTPQIRTVYSLQRKQVTLNLPEFNVGIVHILWSWQLFDHIHQMFKFPRKQTMPIVMLNASDFKSKCKLPSYTN